MKKAKLIPSILMLVLLLGVVSVGIYAAKPSVNNITGSLTIVPPDALVEISASVGNTEVIDTQRVAYGKTFEIENALQLSMQGASEVWEVEDTVLTINITNLSNKELGAYFYSGTGVKDGLATADDILYADTLGDKVDVALSPYRHIGASDANATTDTITMTIGFNLTKLTDDTETHEFNYTLNIEEYVPNYTDESTYVTNLEFAKISSILNGQPRTEVPAEAFAGSPNLRTVCIPTSVTSIGPMAIVSSSLEAIHLANVNTFSQMCVMNMDMETQEMGGIVTMHTELTFDDFFKLDNEEAVQYFGCYNLYLNGAKLQYLKAEDLPQILRPLVFAGCTSIVNADISGVTSIGYAAFAYCGSLKNVKFSTNATQIGKQAFAVCASLEEVYILNASSIGEEAFTMCSSLTNVDITGEITIYAYTFAECPSLTNLTLTNVSIGDRAFAQNETLTNLVLNNVESIGEYAFYGCTSLIEVTLGDNISEIPSSAFMDCTSLTNIDLSGVTSIGEEAFYGCTSLIEVTLGKNLNTIVGRSFEGCNSNLVATYPGTIAEFQAITGYQRLSNHAVVECSDGDFTTKA